MSRHVLLLSFGFLGTLGVASSVLAQPKVETQVVGPLPGTPPSYLISPRGLSVASLTMKGSRSMVVVNGVEGPLIDELLTVNGGQSFTCINSVIFSPDGQSHVYSARVGDNFIVVRDGKEIYRAPIRNLATAGGTGQLAMSPQGKHVSFLEKVDVSASQHAWRLVVDGKAGPLSSNNNSFRLFYSPDDSRWAYVAAKLNGQRDEQFTVVDGKEVSHGGHFIRFTGDNKLVQIAAAADGTWTLSVEGKIAVKGLTDPERKVWLSSVGSRIAAALRKPSGVALWLDGSEVRAAEGARDIAEVAFSPDGKRYLAVCQTAAAHFAITDGKKGMEYRLITWPQFTRDSARAIYVAGAGNRNFVITEGQESEGFEMIGGQYVKIALPQKGPRFAYSTGDGMNRTFSLVADTQAVPLNGKSPAHDTLTFSANGATYALAAAPVGRSEITTLIVNGQEVPDFYPHLTVQGAPNTARREAYFVLSEDGKNVAAPGVKPSTNRRGLYVNNALVAPADRTFSRVAFTPDGKHLFWTTQIPGKGTPVPSWAVFVDGVPAVELPAMALETGASWEMTSTGVYQFVAFADGAIKRYRVTADPAMDVEKAIAATAAADAQAIADAAAAKKQAEDEALAAKKKREDDQAAAVAKAKADREEALAKRQAAAEAKTKARLEALEAKKKAQQKK